MSNIQCQLAVSAIAKELAPNVQGMQFCYRKNSKVLRFVKNINSCNLIQYETGVFVYIIRTRKLFLLIFTCNYDFQ